MNTSHCKCQNVFKNGKRPVGLDLTNGTVACGWCNWENGYRISYPTTKLKETSLIFSSFSVNIDVQVIIMLCTAKRLGCLYWWMLAKSQMKLCPALFRGKGFWIRLPANLSSIAFCSEPHLHSPLADPCHDAWSEGWKVPCKDQDLHHGSLSENNLNYLVMGNWLTRTCF